jgi:hypothetical protein
MWEGEENQGRRAEYCGPYRLHKNLLGRTFKRPVEDMLKHDDGTLIILT